jgi:hypothetical protein
MEEFREIEFEGSMLRVYRNGDIWKWYTTGGIWGEANQWGLLKNNGSSHGYSHIELNKKKILLHRIIAMVYLNLDITNTSLKVDHIDRCRTNNNVTNLRCIPQSKNCLNRVDAGISFRKDSNKWRAYITIMYKRINLGTFNTKEEAREAYLKAKENYHKID